MKFLRIKGIQGYSSSKKEVKEYKTRENEFKNEVSVLKDYLQNIEYPIEIYFHFVRDSIREFDFNNATQILLDLLTAHDIIPDDSMKYIIPIPFKIKDKWYSIDKENPGVWIKLK